MTNPALKIIGISKSFKVPHERHNSLKAQAINIFSSRKFSKYDALKDISFEVEKGEFFGIVGKNGCGKSTLLKILANIYEPTSGQVSVEGNIAPFIELGVGFNMELTGRENVFLSGTILGLSRKKIAALYDDIVDFAELAEFMDQKLKNYSSGMQVRLAFSIAVRAESDILLIDEVLAVGDAAFQAKCFDEFDKLKAKGKTIVLVTHDMNAINRFCSRALLIDHGKVVEIGTSSKIANLYAKLNTEGIKSKTNNISQKSEFVKKIAIVDKNGKESEVFKPGSDIVVDLEIGSSSLVKSVGVAIFRLDGLYCFGTNTSLDEFSIKNKKVSLVLNNIGLLPGTYYITAGFFGSRTNEVLEYIDSAASFRIAKGEIPEYQGVVNISHRWK